MSARTVLFPAVVLLVLAAPAGADPLTAVIAVERDVTFVDSVMLTGAGRVTVPTPDFGGEAGTTDTVALGDHDWPESILLHWRCRGTVMEPFVIDRPEPGGWYDFPTFAGDFLNTRIKFSGPGAVAEPDARPVLARVSARPNPFAGRTVLTVRLARPARVALEVHDAAGTLVRTLAAGDFPAGLHRLAWDGTDDSGNRLAGGVYLARLLAGGEGSVRKLVLTD
jgi:hypothetical protein